MLRLQSTNPSRNYELLGEVEVSTPEEIANKVSEARAALPPWRRTSVKERVRALARLRARIAEEKEAIAKLQTLEVGKPITESRLECDDSLQYFDWYLDNTEALLAPKITAQEAGAVHTLYHEPIGTAAVIIPWNFPLCNFVWGVLPNLLAGNTVVLKHSEECPLTSRFLEGLMASEDLPPGVFSQVFGGSEVGARLVEDNIDLIWFTGSSAVGRELYRAAARRLKPAVLELGGSAPGIVFDDVSIDEVLEPVFFGRFFNCGQVCDGLKRLIVHEDIVDSLVQGLKRLIESKIVGDSENEGTDIGPLVAKRQVELLTEQVADAKGKGGEIVIGGKIPAAPLGAYFQPTLIANVNSDMRVWREEVFGPVLPIVTFRTEEEAVRLANDTDYGLGAYIFTKDGSRALRVAVALETGMVSINGENYVRPCNPFGGYKRSGIGREHGPIAFHDLCRTKLVASRR